ncbi:response regulator transcription factor [Humibacter ginsenosidimutans]|uniref:Response regulator transcription factor n=1 Tax=Humibacter ginsenosidimutans TaxID=2599293 RepID=A0A5B8M2C3_9MICO|nr:response regulator transcription factor [Humibacter ginsenosidimutans]QDZ14104.1 response regulator transcription factor [Humibacter ginsenosidimutans]
MDTPAGLVIVVEDERAIADLERLYLTRAGFGVDVVADGTSALSAIRTRRPVAVVLDVGLPGVDGVELCRRLRAEDDWTPIMFVSARDDEIERLVALELGGDDYLTKPFSPRELVTRLKVLLRRTSGGPLRHDVRLGPLVLDQHTRSATLDGLPLTLTATEFDLLSYFARSPGRVFTREQLLASVWGHADYASGRTVDVHIAQLRAKLGAGSGIRTVRGVGYAIDAPTVAAGSATGSATLTDPGEPIG